MLLRMTLKPFFPCLALALSLNACAEPALRQVRGQVRGWTFGAGRAEFLSDELRTLSAANIDPVGRFTLRLPDPATVRPLLQPSLIPDVPAGCTTTVRASAAGAEYYTLGDITAYPSGGTKRAALTLVSEDRSGGQDPGQDSSRLTKRLFVYASQGVRVSGELRCTAGSQQASARYALDLKPGWNRVASEQTLHRSGASETTVLNVGDDGFERWTVAR